MNNHIILYTSNLLIIQLKRTKNEYTNTNSVYYNETIMLKLKVI